jgi:hypothetical protein
MKTLDHANPREQNHQRRACKSTTETMHCPQASWVLLL